MKHFLFIALLAISLNGCGSSGGGGSETAEPSNQTSVAQSQPQEEQETKQSFMLREEEEDSPDYEVMFELSGNTSDGIEIDGLLIIESMDDQIAFGKECRTTRKYLELSANNQTLITSIHTTFYSKETGNPVLRINNITGAKDLPSSFSDMPDMAYVGEFGKIASWKLSNGMTTQGTWRLDQLTQDKAKLVIFSEVLDSYGRREASEKQTLKVDTSGYVHSATLEIYYVNTGRAYILEGKRVK